MAAGAGSVPGPGLRLRAGRGLLARPRPGHRRKGRRQRTRPVQGIDQNLRLNRALWMLAEGMRQLKS